MPEDHFDMDKVYQQENSKKAVREAKRDVKKIEAAVQRFVQSDLEEKDKEKRCEDINALTEK